VVVKMNAPAKKTSKLLRGATGEWEVVIGMEVHAQITSNAKLFSGAATAFGAAPNSQVSLVDAAMPGMLPVINQECVRQAVRTGLGLNAKINLKSVFDRKNYFFPDLPQGYQISQFKSPIVGEGEVVVDLEDGESCVVGIERLHLEQDAGKMLHDQHPTMSLVDLNRSGVALMEIVSKPDIRSADQAMAYVAKLRSILRYLGTCDGDMEKGNLRADVNVSVRRPGEALGTRCEIKNVNSIRFIGQAVDCEARRQIDVIEDGGVIEQETRLFDPNKSETRSMRSKEEAHDYRYFPDPDLLPLEFSQAFVDDLETHLPELPDVKKARYINEYGLSAYQAAVLVAEKERATYFEEMVKDGAQPKLAANWLINEYLGRMNRRDDLPSMDWQQPLSTPVSPRPTANVGGLTVAEPILPPSTSRNVVLGPVPASANTEIVKLISSGEISSTAAKELLEIVIRIGPVVEPVDIRIIVRHRGMEQMRDDSLLEGIIDQVIAQNPDKVPDVRANPKALGWFVGQVMKASGGKANPQAVNDLLKSKLGV
jgi:aspartyl-tRNA(Asn)/glutamyl-tRNA(Gln) amidotransferase subunit B